MGQRMAMTASPTQNCCCSTVCGLACALAPCPEGDDDGPELEEGGGELEEGGGADEGEDFAPAFVSPDEPAEHGAGAFGHVADFESVFFFAGVSDSAVGDCNVSAATVGALWSVATDAAAAAAAATDDGEGAAAWHLDEPANAGVLAFGDPTSAAVV